TVDGNTYYTTSFEITGNTYDAGVYEITSKNVPFMNPNIYAGVQNIFSNKTFEYLGVYEADINNAFSQVEIEIKLPKKIILSEYTFFAKDGVTDDNLCPSDWTLYTKVDDTWKVIDSRSSQGSTVVGNDLILGGDTNVSYRINPVYTDTLRFIFTLAVPKQSWYIGELQLFNQNPMYITDIKQYTDQPDYSVINVHPKNPTFGFHQLTHSVDVGIAGNQLDDALLRIVKFGPENQLADLEVGNLKISGDSTLTSLNVSGDSTLTSLNVSGDSTLTSLNVSGDSTLTSLNVSGDSTLRGLTVNSANTTVIFDVTHPDPQYYSQFKMNQIFADPSFEFKSHIYNTNVNKPIFSIITKGNYTAFKVNADTTWSTQIGGGTHSDDRLKINEKMISDVSPLLKLRPQVYDKLFELTGNIEDARFESGLIAQEIWYDAPEFRHLVTVGKDGQPADVIETSDDPSVDPDYSSWGPEVASVNYTGFIPYLIRGFQEQHAENLALKAQIAMLMKAVGLVDSGNVDS
ncbi:MAG: hypothetical protein CL842_05570, partial [Crocinitomicaceae bacterium]|nr:hypothetical protein [Crocinitomicaceae bacterium]